MIEVCDVKWSPHHHPANANIVEPADEEATTTAKRHDFREGNAAAVRLHYKTLKPGVVDHMRSCTRRNVPPAAYRFLSLHSFNALYMFSVEFLYRAPQMLFKPTRNIDRHMFASRH